MAKCALKALSIGPGKSGFPRASITQFKREMPPQDSPTALVLAFGLLSLFAMNLCYGGIRGKALRIYIHTLFLVQPR
jgi:hypothetical protein